MDLAPFALTLSGVLFFLALFKFQLFSLVPIALTTLYQSLPDGILVFDRHNQLVDANGPAQNYLKVTRKDIGTSADKVLSDWPDIRNLARDSDGSIRAEVKCDFHSMSGWFELELFPLCDGGQSNTGRMMVIRDISVRKKAEEDLRYQLEFEKMVVQVSATFINNPSTQLNQAINEALRSCGEFFRVDRSYIFVFSADGATMDNTNEWCAEGIEPQMEKMRDFPVSALPWWEERIYNSDYLYIPDVAKLPPEAEAEKKEFKRQDIQSLLTIPIFKEDRVAGFLGFDSVRQKRIWTVEQISLLRVIAEIIFSALKKYQYESHLEYLTFYDSLTGLYNRGYFNNELKRLGAGREFPVTIITTDLNGLKLVNDTMGHAEGDEHLKEYANLVKGCLRGSDILARVGGDELAALLPGTGREAAEEIVNRIRARENLYNREQRKGRLPLSIAVGMATTENADTPLGEVFREADDLMYRDKLQHGASARAQITSALLSSLEERNFTSAAQVQRLTRLCQKMAGKLGLPPRQLSNLSLLARAHDLGNLSIPDHILFKKEGLTEEEWEIMREHPEKGYRIAKFTPELSGVADLILRHHEKWDGSGYPLKIKGGQIPIECRILSIVDAYDAMTTQRPYRKAVSREQAVAEIKKNSGTQFDPQLVEIFLEVLREQS